MEILCARCKAEYEFDDALVSARGTSVRCTRCGFHFRVQRHDISEADERWVVYSPSGGRREYLTLRELQRGITEGELAREDMLVDSRRGKRALGSIPELASFFGGARRSSPPRGSWIPATLPKRGAALSPAAEDAEPTIDPRNPVIPRAAGVPSEAAMLPLEGPPPSSGSSPKVGLHMSSPLPPPSPLHKGASPSWVSILAPKPRSLGGWVGAVTLSVLAVFVSFVVARPYLGGTRAGGTMDLPAEDVLAQAELALDRDDVDGARGSVDRLLLHRAHAEDAVLLRARLLELTLDLRALEQIISGSATPKADPSLIDAALSATEAAMTARPTDPTALRCRMQILRLAGQSLEARKLVDRLVATATEPSTAYVLAALDAGEKDPVWSMITGRLRTALSGRSPGRPLALLVFTLGEMGELSAATAELERLSVRLPGHPLIEPLRQRNARLRERGMGLTLTASRGSSTAAVPSGERQRSLLEQAVARNPGDADALSALGEFSRRAGDVQKAAAYFRQGIRANPSHIPSLVGLADSLWDLGNRPDARTAYGDVVARFPRGAYPAYVRQRATSPLPRALDSVPMGSTTTRFGMSPQ